MFMRDRKCRGADQTLGDSALSTDTRLQKETQRRYTQEKQDSRQKKQKMNFVDVPVYVQYGTLNLSRQIQKLLAMNFCLIFLQPEQMTLLF